MAVSQGRGSFIENQFHSGSIPLTSQNPSCFYEPVFQTTYSESHVDGAVAAARRAHETWRAWPQAQRIQALLSLKASFIRHEAAMAEAIANEMGKIHSEAMLEAKSLSARIDLIISQGLKRVAHESLYDLRAETRHHSQGVLAVIGPFNFPAHLVNAHVIPSIALGNTVVIKPSPLTPMVGEIYAQCVSESNILPGVVNVIQGGGDIGKLLSLHRNIDGVLFTGSYETGRLLKEALLDQPAKMLALEMGGKNIAVVMDDADMGQALSEIIQGAVLTTGQRCTATSRVLIHESIYAAFKQKLVAIMSELRPTKAMNNTGMFGPLASKGSLDRLVTGLETGLAEGARPLLPLRTLEGGAFVTPSVFEVSSDHRIEGYLSQELFGPHIAIESFATFDQAMARVNQNPYGLSNALFTLDRRLFDRMYLETKSGLLNLNRSTNGALGQMAFGGVGKSGNYHPAGIEAVRYASFPVATVELPYGAQSADKNLQAKIQSQVTEEVGLPIILARHRLESLFEQWDIYSDQAALDRVIFSKNSFSSEIRETTQFWTQLRELMGPALSMDEHQLTFHLSAFCDRPEIFSHLDSLLRPYAQGLGLTLAQSRALNVNVPESLKLPRSRAMLDRLYKNNFVPAEKKPLVADLQQSRGAYLVSVDDDPLVILDAASQIATLGAGFMADTYQNAYDCQTLDLSILKNAQTHEETHSVFEEDARAAQASYESFLHEKSHHAFKSVAYGASGAEANEIAFDLCRQNGPGGTRIIAFEGAFHGRTIIALQATYNKEKRGPFAFAGYEATFLPFPVLLDPQNQPAIPQGFLATLSKGEIPAISTDDPLLSLELQVLAQVKSEVERGNINCVIIEPMQCEGGDRYASNRFFNGLRALTRGLKVPLVFDEVQTGFGLGRKFFWYQQFELVDAAGRPDVPDCLTMGKKAQTGITLSVWENPRVYEPHVIQLKRGLLQGQAIEHDLIDALQEKAKRELLRLKEYFPTLVHNPRAVGLAFAFDMPTSALANRLIEERFMRGFMAYIAGEKTIRFRLNRAFDDETIRTLFGNIFCALKDIKDDIKVTGVAQKSLPDVETNNSLDSTIHVLTAALFDQYEPQIKRIEEETYEPNRRDSMATLRKWTTTPDNLCLLITTAHEGTQKVAGYAFGGPMEESNVDGPLQDPLRGQNVAYYSANFTLDKTLHGRGLGVLLKNEQVKRVTLMKKPDGSPRFIYLTGRNRVGFTSQMNKINDRLGAYTVGIFEGQYQDPKAQAAQYRLPLFKTSHPVKAPPVASVIDCRNHSQKLWQVYSTSLFDAVKNNYFRPLVGSKLTLSNWATPNMVRYSELLRALMPAHLQHAYFTSGRDEVVDKGLRSLRFHRTSADIAIGFSHQWFGNNTAAARSLSHDEGQKKPFGYFSWPKIAHPAVVGNDQSLSELKAVLKSLDPDKVLGIVVELMGEKSAFTFDNAFLQELANIRAQTGIPLVFNETVSAFYRNGCSLFLSDTLDVKANMVWWFTGGQLGHVFVDDQYFVEKPLQLISTWDGDDISIARAYHHLVSAQKYGKQDLSAKFATFLEPIKDRVAGVGLWRRLTNVSAPEKIIANARQAGILLGRGFDQSVLLCPPLDLCEEEISRLKKTLVELFQRDPSER